MNLHEYQSKELFAQYGIPVPSGRVASTPDAAVAAARELGGSLWVVKAQVHAGGRGKAGGVKVCRTHEEVRTAAAAMFGIRLVTHQTGPEGLPVSQVYVEVGSAIAREIYLSLLLNRDRSRLSFIASSAGVMDIEEVAAHHPEQILRVEIHPAAGLQGYQCRQLAFGLGLAGPQIAEFEKIARGLYALYLDKDASLVEVNPLIVTKEGNVLALDAKINIDANAVYRQQAVAAYRDPTQEDPMERQASEHDLNFLDVGGGATADRVTAAFRLILSNPNVRAVLVNIFGGIVRCDLIAEGIINAVKNVGVKVPVIVRLEGTNAEVARAALAKSGLAITPAKDLTDAATKAVSLAAQSNGA